MPVLESVIERRCALYAEKHGGILLKISRRLGWPDRVCLLPNGRHFFVEFKREGGELMPIQRHTLELLNKMNHHAFEIDNHHLFIRIYSEHSALPPP